MDLNWYIYASLFFFQVLFTHLVQFFCDLCIQDPPQLEFADRLTQHLFELTQLSPLAAAQAVVMNIADRQEEFRQICEKKAGRGLYPGLDTVSFSMENSQKSFLLYKAAMKYMQTKI